MDNAQTEEEQKIPTKSRWNRKNLRKSVTTKIKFFFIKTQSNTYRRTTASGLLHFSN